MKKIISLLAGLAATAVLLAQSYAGGMENDSAASDKTFGGFDLSSVETPGPFPAIPAETAKPDISAHENPWNEYISEAFGGIKAEAEPYETGKSPSNAGQTLERINLEEILDANLETGLTFKTSGNTVHISGAMAVNCSDGGSRCGPNDKYFLLFHTDKEQTIFVKAKDIANMLLLSGKQEISFNGDEEKYTARFFVKASSPGQSRLKIETRGRVVLEISVDELSAALAEKGHRLKSGAQHNLYYNTEVVQDSDGNARFGEGRVVTFSPRSSDPNQYIRASLITAAGVLLNAVEPGLGFRIAGGVLEIYRQEFLSAG
jgi:hypothetical protein